MLDLDLTAVVFNLSRVLNIFLISGLSQGVDLSDTLRSMRGVCFPITKESMFVQFYYPGQSNSSCVWKITTFVRGTKPKFLLNSVVMSNFSCCPFN